MALKTFFIMSLLITAMTFHSAKAQGIIGVLLGLIHIQGSVLCSPRGNMTTNGIPTPPFPNAEVQLQCGGKMVSSTTTNDAGAFEMMIDPMQFVLSSLLSGCELVVTSPLSNCNAMLPPVGGLVSTLELLGSSVLGNLLVANLAPSGFQFTPKIN